MFVSMTVSNSHVHCTVTDKYTFVYFSCVCFPVFFLLFFRSPSLHSDVHFFLAALELSTFTFAKRMLIIARNEISSTEIDIGHYFILTSEFFNSHVKELSFIRDNFCSLYLCSNDHMFTVPVF